MPTRAFAETDELDRATLAAAPVHWPRPSRLDDDVDWKPAPAAAAAEALGIETVGALLEHLPRDTGEARTIGELQVDETATVLVEVRGISSRPVRRRGMKPLVEATVTDGTGVMKATFFNQPWLANQYKPGTRLMLAGKYQGRNRFRVNTHARTEEVAAVGDSVAEYPATKGITSTQIMARVREHRPRDRRRGRAAARRGACRRAAADPAGRDLGRALRRPRGRPPAARVRRAPARPDRPAPPAARAARRAARGAARGPADALTAVAGGAAAVHADERPGQRDGGGRRGPRLRAPDGAAAHGRGRLGQDRRRAARDAPRGRAWHAGGAHGADRDARRAALRDAPGADAGRARPRRAAHRLDPGGAAGRPARQPGQRRAAADRRHPRADRGHGRVRPPRGRGRRRAAPLRRPPARRARREGRAGGTGSRARTCST